MQFSEPHFLEPPREAKIGSKYRELIEEIWDKITVFHWVKQIKENDCGLSLVGGSRNRRSDSRNCFALCKHYSRI